jgi:hypothetical protein
LSAVDLFRAGPITNPQPAKVRLEYPNFGDLSGGAVLVYFGYVPEINPLSSSSYPDGSIYQYDGLDIIEKIELQELSTVETSEYAFTNARLTHVIPKNYGSGYDPIVYLPDANDDYVIVMDPRLYTLFYYPETDSFVLYFSMKPSELEYDSNGMPTKMPKITCYKYVSIVGLENFIPAGAGLQGLQGVQGFQGSGVQGLQGSPGPTGLQGNQGLQGLQGFQGIQGNNGIFIVSGTAPTAPTEGTVWFNCLNGKKFIWYDGYWVETGSSWVTQGPQGSSGMQGAQGIQGIQGMQGAQGIQGMQGAQGAQGTQGLQGVQGTQGFQGFGMQGVQGASGQEMFSQFLLMGG